MNEPRKKNPTFGIGVFIVVVVLLVIGTVLFNAMRSKHAYDETRQAPEAEAQSGSAAVGAGASRPGGAAQ